MAVDADAHYALARERLGLSRREDEAAARLLSRRLVDRFVLHPDRLRALVAGRTVLVLGAGSADLDVVRRAAGSMPVIVAGSAIGPAWRAGVRPALLVSDLDGDAQAHVDASRACVPLFVHAHGDNVDLVEAMVPRLAGPLVGTSQTPPPAAPVPLHRWGGFTDGDRACFVAAALGATRVLASGCSFLETVSDQEIGSSGNERPEKGSLARKREKLRIARELVRDLRVPISAFE